MFRIGEFSRFSRVSVKMLRHYDELGLLPPARVDPYTNYRYYSADQLPRLHRIVALKDLGFRLDEIGVLLDGELSVEQLLGMLKLRRGELQQQMRDTAAQLAQTEARLRQVERAHAAPRYDVVLRSVEPQLMAGIRQAVGEGSETVTAIFEELEAYVAQHGARSPLPPLMLYHDREFLEQAEDVEVMVPVQGPLQGNGRVETRRLPGEAQMACLVHTGRYDGLAEAFTVLLNWIEANEFNIVGPTREVYLRFGADQEAYTLPDVYVTEVDEEFVTELQVPVRDARDEQVFDGRLS
ncbi:MAG: MerR family transcriptional regulator [Chloroflexota bacterium]